MSTEWFCGGFLGAVVALAGFELVFNQSPSMGTCIATFFASYVCSAIVACLYAGRRHSGGGFVGPGPASLPSERKHELTPAHDEGFRFGYTNNDVDH